MVLNRSPGPSNAPESRKESPELLYSLIYGGKLIGFVPSQLLSLLLDVIAGETKQYGARALRQVMSFEGI